MPAIPPAAVLVAALAAKADGDDHAAADLLDMDADELAALLDGGEGEDANPDAGGGVHSDDTTEKEHGTG